MISAKDTSDMESMSSMKLAYVVVGISVVVLNVLLCLRAAR